MTGCGLGRSQVESVSALITLSGALFRLSSLPMRQEAAGAFVVCRTYVSKQAVTRKARFGCIIVRLDAPLHGGKDRRLAY